MSTVDVTSLMNQFMPIVNLFLTITLIVTLIKELKEVFS